MKRSYFKLNIDDVMEIVSEHLAVSEGFECFSSKTQIVEENDKCYMLIAIGELEDSYIDNLNMDKLNKEIKYNGSHEEEGYWKSDDEIKEALDKFKRKN